MLLAKAKARSPRSAFLKVVLLCATLCATALVLGACHICDEADDECQSWLAPSDATAVAAVAGTAASWGVRFDNSHVA
jgi:hypothetical protein